VTSYSKYFAQKSEMMLNAGTKLGPYEISGALGAGGMGEVYRARDTRLGRDVAIKVLPQAFASDAERLRRFEQEARAASALNHPNILGIYDISAHDGAPFLVMELLEGETLRERLRNGPLPVRKALDIAMQCASGVAAAHEKGIIHRDLKPANIFVTNDGRVKILDFGLAKLTESNQSSGMSETQSPTRTSGGDARTEAGVVLGTAGYMSPEQVRGKPADARSDIFALGTILYEMLSGQRAFERDSSADTMAAILKEEPPELSGEGKKIPPAIERVVRRCLEKQPQSRFQSASDLAFALDALSGTGVSSAAVPAMKDAGRKRTWIVAPAIAAAVVALVVIGAILLLRRSTAAAPGFTQLTFRPAFIRHARFAPDGRTVVYDAAVDGKPMGLFSTRTDTAETQPLAINASVLSISSSGEMAVALAPDFEMPNTPVGTLARVPLGGGTTREMLDNVTDAEWNADGSALAISHRVDSHYQLEYPAGTVLYQTKGYMDSLRFSPAGDRIAFIDHPILGDDRGTIDVIDLHGNRKVLTAEYSSAQGLAWSPTGDEIWFAAAVASEPRELRAVTLAGRERTILAAPIMLHLQDVSRDGDVLLSTDDYRDQQLLQDGPNGAVHDLSSFTYEITYAISRDGRMLLFNSYDTGASSDYNLYTQETDGSAPALIGVGSAIGLSFDGKWAIAIDPNRRNQLELIPIGVGQTRTLNAPSGLIYQSAAWMPDGEHLVVSAFGPNHPAATFIQDAVSGASRQITPDGRYLENIEQSPVGVSPDGKYCLTTDGEFHYWIQPTDGGKATELKGLDAGDLPVEWHNDSHHLFLRRYAGTAEVDIYDFDISSGKPKLWMQFSPSDKSGLVNAVHNVVITPDGKHVLFGVGRIYSKVFLVKGLR
jgi:eukaryotic-like serine/threonine-protein kinase